MRWKTFNANYILSVLNPSETHMTTNWGTLLALTYESGTTCSMLNRRKLASELTQLSMLKKHRKKHRKRKNCVNFPKLQASCALIQKSLRKPAASGSSSRLWLRLSPLKDTSDSAETHVWLRWKTPLTPLKELVPTSERNVDTSDRA